MSRMKKSHRLRQAAATLMQISARREKRGEYTEWIDQIVSQLTILASQEEAYEKVNPQAQRSSKNLSV